MTSTEKPIYLVNFEEYLKPKAASKQIQQLKQIQQPYQAPSNQTEQHEANSSFDLFCKSSSIHGLSMLALTHHSSIYDRLIWYIIILASIVATVLTLYSSAMINSATPTVTHIESTHYPVYNVRFPAVSLCSLNRMAKRKTMKLAEIFASRANMTVEEVVYLFRTQFAVEEEVSASAMDLDRFDRLLTANNYSLYDYLIAVTPDCMKNILRCMWKGRTLPCDSLFEVISVPRGRCCAFNYYARPDNQSNRKDQSFMPPVPRHVNGDGPETALSVLIDPETDDYMAGFLKTPGYRVIIHDAYNYPEDNSDNEFLPIKTVANVAAWSQITYGTTYLSNMAIEKRGCIFNSEYKLKFFRQYSFWNCLAECMNSKVLKMCGCVPHNIVRFPAPEICNVTRFPCAVKAADDFQELMETKDTMGTNICGCMPECSFNSYRTKTSLGPFNRTFAKTAPRFYKNITVKDQILLHVFFNDLATTIYRIDVLESWQSVIGTVGGITGITMGFSVVSLSEAFFFLCVRPVYLKCVTLAAWVKASILPNYQH